MSWGGYSFIINLLPIYCLVCIFTGRLSSRLYVAFAPLIVIGTLSAGGWQSSCMCTFPARYLCIIFTLAQTSHGCLTVYKRPFIPFSPPPCAASVPVVGFNAVLMSEHFGAFFAFAVLHVAMLVRYLHSTLGGREWPVLDAMFTAILCHSPLQPLLCSPQVMPAGPSAAQPTTQCQFATETPPTHCSSHTHMLICPHAGHFMVVVTSLLSAIGIAWYVLTARACWPHMVHLITHHL